MLTNPTVPAPSIPDDFYYAGEQDDFDCFAQAEDTTAVEIEKEGEDFSDWAEPAPIDPEFVKHIQEERGKLKKKEMELEKISHILSKKKEQQRDEDEKKQRLHALKVDQRRQDVKYKLGVHWGIARQIMSNPQRGTNNDREFLRELDRLRTLNPDNSVYMKALESEISRIAVGYDHVTRDWEINVYCRNIGSFRLSLHLMENRSVSELWVLLNKVKRDSDLNELLRDQLKDFAHKASPQVVYSPFQVKYMKGDTLQSCNLDNKSLALHTANHLVYIEHMLRTTGFATPDKLGAADVIQAYCTENVKRYSQMKNKLKAPKAQPVKPVANPSESERVFDKDLLLSLKNLEDRKHKET